ncbi:unnamed protein product [Acanthosepion pharaonis]|uniref:Uncharacterized protein n=1 Tax=Acanthosepion pharaonis TaxID=158019 RepID=A0A812DYV5_ACAPH|nr:unnamed protein product [Sepia pharaonis]
MFRFVIFGDIHTVSPFSTFSSSPPSIFFFLSLYLFIVPFTSPLSQTTNEFDTAALCCLPVYWVPLPHRHNCPDATVNLSPSISIPALHHPTFTINRKEHLFHNAALPLFLKSVSHSLHLSYPPTTTPIPFYHLLLFSHRALLSSSLSSKYFVVGQVTSGKMSCL